jgi:hypothetical protein
MATFDTTFSPFGSWRHWRIWRQVTIVAGNRYIVQILLQRQRVKSERFDEVAIANTTPSAPLIESLWIGHEHWWNQSDIPRLPDDVDVLLYRLE